MSSAHVSEKAPVRTSLVVVLLVLAAVVGAVTGLFVYGFNVEYGPTSGSWMDGALRSLAGSAVALLLVGVLAGAAFFLGRQATWARVLAVAVVVASAVGVLVAGGQAAVVKYDRLAKVPYCGTEIHVTGSGAAAMEFARLKHPGPFGGGFSGIDGCGANLLNATLTEAAAHYRAELPAAGWTITRDDTSELAARRNDLIFVLNQRCGMVMVEIRRAGTASMSQC